MTDRLWNSNYIKVLIGNFLVQFSFTLIVPLLPLYLSETFGATKDVIGLVLVGYSVIGLVVRPFSGYLVDVFPRRAVLLVCCFFFFVFTSSYFSLKISFNSVENLLANPCSSTTLTVKSPGSP